MGSKLFKSTVNEYGRQLKKVDVVNLKELWPAISLYKMKQMFEMQSHRDEEGQRYLPFDAFICMMPGIKLYTEIQQRRVFRMFCGSQAPRLYWQDFFLFISICYFGAHKDLAILLFMIFDSNLSRQLTQEDLSRLLVVNEDYLFSNIDMPAILKQIAQMPSTSLEEWGKQSIDLVDYEKYRKMFYILAEQKIEKEMVNHFSEWNEFYEEDEDRYCCHLVSYKWFQAWMFYVGIEYSVQINEDDHQNISKVMRTSRSLKNCKGTIKTIKSISLAKSFRKIPDTPKIKPIHLQGKNMGKNPSFDLTYGHLGEKPRAVYNTLLEGEYSKVLLPHLTNQVQYVPVSSKVWTALKRIYGGQVELARKGRGELQIYLRLIKIYSTQKGGFLDYSPENERVMEVSDLTCIEDIFLKSESLSRDELQDKSLFWKVIGADRWSPIESETLLVLELTFEPIVFLAHVPNQLVEGFKENHCVPAKSIFTLHIGDEVSYQIDPKHSRPAIYLGKTGKNKHIFHFQGTPHINDLCLSEKQFQERITLKREELRVRSRLEKGVLLAGVKELGFVDCLLLQVFANEVLVSGVLAYSNHCPCPFLQQLAFLMIKFQKCRRLEPKDVYSFVSACFPYFLSGSPYHSREFMEDFFDQLTTCLQNHAEEILLPYRIDTEVACIHCRVTAKSTSLYHLNLPVPEESFEYYEIVYIPYAHSMKISEYKRYGITLPPESTLRAFKCEFEKIALLEDVPYLLVEVDRDRIIKKYEGLDVEAKLFELKLRPEDKIYAYQLPTHLDSFINDHYYHDKIIKGNTLVQDQMIDFKLDEKTWTFGTVTSLIVEPYTHNLKATVDYRLTRNEQATITITVDSDQAGVAVFPTKSYQFAEHYYVRLVQKVYNQVNGQMEICNLPLVFMLASWMRLKEVELIVYQLVRGFISEPFRFKNLVDDRINKKDKILRFKEYLKRKESTEELRVPYTIQFTDTQGRCQCYKMHKAYVSEGQRDYVCAGCPLDEQTPISWQIKPAQMEISVVWKSPQSFVRCYIAESISVEVMRANRRNNSNETLQSCFQLRFRQPYERLKSAKVCCMLEESSLFEQILHSTSSYLPIFLDRVLEESHFKSLNYTSVSFKLEGMVVCNQAYELCGAIGILKKDPQLKYFSYILQGTQWHEHTTAGIRQVAKSTIQKTCAIALFYRRAKDKQISPQK